MLKAITLLRPSLSTSQPPSKPNTPPHSADIQRSRPTQSVTMGLFNGIFNSSAIAGAATSGVINNSYVSKRKPMLAMVSTSQAVRESLDGRDSGGFMSGYMTAPRAGAQAFYTHSYEIRFPVRFSCSYSYSYTPLASRPNHNPRGSLSSILI